MSEVQNPKKSFAPFFVIGVVLLAIAAYFVYHEFVVKRNREAEEAKAKAEALAKGANVTVAKAQKGPSVRKLTLIGEALPLQSTTLYSKVSGYLSKIHVDVGDRVKAGQVIAEIQSPELDAQIATISTGLENKRQLARRARELTEKGFFSQQALDNAESDVRVAESQIRELRTLTSYRVLRAPYAGTVTARFADRGALVQNAATNQTAALPLVTIADTTRLKVTVYVEQADAPIVKPGLPAEVVDAASPDRKISAKVTRVSGELDSRTRTLVTEVEFDNSKGQFIPGSFLNVSLLIPTASFIEVPSGALVNRDKKTMVIVVDKDNTAHYVPITVANTDGKVLRIASGVEEGTVVAVGAPVSLADGGKVNPQQPPGAPPAPAKPAEAPKPGEPAKAAASGTIAPAAPSTPASGAQAAPATPAAPAKK